MIGENIKRYRLEKSLTQKELAEKSGITRESIGNYERGDRTPPADILNKIALALDVTTDDLITGGVYSSSYILKNSTFKENKDKSYNEKGMLTPYEIANKLKEMAFLSDKIELDKFQLVNALKIIIENKCFEPKYKDFIMDDEGNLKIENCNKVIDYLILQYKIYVDIVNDSK